MTVRRLTDYNVHECKVSSFSTGRVLKNTYSLHCRLSGEMGKARVDDVYIEIWYDLRMIEVLPRRSGENGHYINERHIIDIRVRKPGAFEHYCYKDDMFASIQFRMAYDLVDANLGMKRGNKEYL